jgi:hypothetical protein
VQNFVVMQLIRVAGRGTPIRKARLVVTGAPDGSTPDGVKAALEKAGLAGEYSDGGLLWGNHDLQNTEHLRAQVQGLDEARSLTWSDFVDQRDHRRITLRLGLDQYDRILIACKAENQSIQVFTVEAIMAAVEKIVGAAAQQANASPDPAPAQPPRRRAPRRRETTPASKATKK